MDLELEKLLRAAILAIPGIGSQRLRRLIALAGSAAEAAYCKDEIFNSGPKPFWLEKFLTSRPHLDPEKTRRNLGKHNISLVIPEEERYPCLLTECSGSPPLLFYKGFLKPGLEGVAVVGTRKATAYGKAAASCLSGMITEENFAVVSGLARGIDSAAHEGAIKAGGTTWAFLAGGLDHIYPPENTGLAGLILEKGAILSEYPPGMPTEAGHFPARNRLISGSSRGVIVVEAALKSGSLITVDFALEQGREVFAVPGPIFSGQSKGTHYLLKMGAKLVAEKEDIFAELLAERAAAEIDNKKEYKTENKTENERGPKIIDPCQLNILECLSDVPLHIDRLTMNCPFPAGKIVLGLLELQLSGKILQLPGQYYVLKR